MAAAPSLTAPAPKLSREQLLRLTQPRLNQYIPIKPHPRQAAFLLLNDTLEVFYGGAGGGGKSEALLTAAAQYVDVPGYSALIVRRTVPQLRANNAIMARSIDWWTQSDSIWNASTLIRTFPSGAKIQFVSMPNELDYNKIGRGPEFQTICIDELTGFTEIMYSFMFSRLRKPSCPARDCHFHAEEHRLNGCNCTGRVHLPLAHVPLRMRSGSTPGDIGHNWVYQRFLVEGRSKGRVFIPAKLKDNPSIDQASYIVSLGEMDPVSRAQILDGNWSVRIGGSLFKREWFADRIVDEFPEPVGQLLRTGKGNRYWDFAATPVMPSNTPGRKNDPDYSSGTRSVMYMGELYVWDIQALRDRPLAVQTRVQRTAEIDGRPTPIYIEQEPGAAGVQVIDDYQRSVLPGYIVRPDKVTGDKVTRATLLSSMAEARHVWLLRASWNNLFLNQAEAFGLGIDHDDTIDSTAGSLNKQVTGVNKQFSVRPLEI
jgi:predicted phage terminase large subunit-like protein